ncbi:MAG: ABC transporter permease subunit [Actinobacteria bacterium]|nr:ABC transporter permease subunit [Actinomycetota bacterium]
MVVGFAIAMVLSVAAIRYRRLYGPITATAGVIFTIPSFALFFVLAPFTGLTVLTAEIGLVLYTLLVLVRNTVAGLDGVPEDVKEAARGMGYTRNRLFLEIELPLAIPVIIAGLRIATVTTVGLVTITALITFGGLGRFIIDGLQQNLFVPKLVVGALGPTLLALALDGLLLLLQRAITPWSRRAAAL